MATSKRAARPPKSAKPKTAAKQSAKPKTAAKPQPAAEPAPEQPVQPELEPDAEPQPVETDVVGIYCRRPCRLGACELQPGQQLAELTKDSRFTINQIVDAYRNGFLTDRPTD